MPGCRVMLDHLDKTPLKDGKGRKSRKRCRSSVTFVKNMSSHKLWRESMVSLYPIGSWTPSTWKKDSKSPFCRLTALGAWWCLMVLDGAWPWTRLEPTVSKLLKSHLVHDTWRHLCKTDVVHWKGSGGSSTNASLRHVAGWLSYEICLKIASCIHACRMPMHSE